MAMESAFVGWCLRGGVTARNPVVGGYLAHNVVAQIWRLVHYFPPIGCHGVVLLSLKKAHCEAFLEQSPHAAARYGIFVNVLHCWKLNLSV